MNIKRLRFTQQFTATLLATRANVIAGIAITALVLCAFPGCTTPEYGPSDVPSTTKDAEDTVTQVSTIDALLAGAYDGVMSYDQLAGYGDFGIGTFAKLDGEMLAFDGSFYQVKADGVAYEVDGSMETPFAAVTFFESDMQKDVPGDTTYDGFQTFLDGLLPTANIFYAIRVDGVFDYMKTRSVPGQEKPYPPLVEVTANQPEFEFSNVAGTLVGFRCPDYVSGINVPGYHVHFLTEDRTAGGHVLDFTISAADVNVDYSTSFHMILPEDGSDFYGYELAGDKQEELALVEK